MASHRQELLGRYLDSLQGESGSWLNPFTWFDSPAVAKAKDEAKAKDITRSADTKRELLAKVRSDNYYSAASPAWRRATEESVKGAFIGEEERVLAAEGGACERAALRRRSGLSGWFFSSTPSFNESMDHARAFAKARTKNDGKTAQLELSWFKSHGWSEDYSRGISPNYDKVVFKHNKLPKKISIVLSGGQHQIDSLGAFRR